MSRRLPSSWLALLVLLAFAPVLLAACGDSHTKVTTGTYAGESGKNAPYLDVGPLAYEVQLSRQLNPVDTEDSSYLLGLTPAQLALSATEEWFGVFIQVYNNDDTPAPAATEMTISDTQNNVYAPLAPDQTNHIAYRAGTVPGKGRIPAPDSIAASDSTQASLLLFKIKTASLNNRPLTIKIVDPDNASETASAELDV
jgi:hypothetical protein